jgi:SAM-dependent methyltransferase
MSESLKRTIEIVMIIVLIGIGTAFLLMTWGSKDQVGNPGYHVAQETQSAAFRENSTELDPADTVKLNPFLPTPMCVVEKMLELADVDEDDIVYDLGYGDGRIVIAAAERYGAHGVGLDIFPQWVKKSQSHALKAGVESLKDEFGKEHTVFVYRPQSSIYLFRILQRTHPTIASPIPP